MSYSDLKIFYRFLKENGILTQYVKNREKNLKRGGLYLTQEDFVQAVKKNEYLNSKIRNILVGNSFAWVDTPQGADFWVKINKKWKDFCYENEYE